MIYELSLRGQSKPIGLHLGIKQFQGKSLTTRVDACLKLETYPKSWTRSQLITRLRPTSNKSLFSGDRKPIDITKKPFNISVFNS
jgi:hypothetical protein